MIVTVKTTNRTTMIMMRMEIAEAVGATNGETNR